MSKKKHINSFTKIDVHLPLPAPVTEIFKTIVKHVIIGRRLKNMINYTIVGI